MHFPPNTLVTITELTRRFRVLDTDLETWCREGVLPAPIWAGGRRHWYSNQINQLINGCNIHIRHQKSAPMNPETDLWTALAVLCIFFTLIRL